MSAADGTSAEAGNAAAEGGTLLAIWDGDRTDHADGAHVLLWRGGAAGAGRRTIIEYLEAHADEVRRRYLAWAHDLGELRVMGRRLRERFIVSDGASLWAQSLFVEQSAWKQPSQQEVLKLLALELLLGAERPGRVEFSSANRALSATVMRLCERHGASFLWKPLRGKRRINLGALLRQLPRPLLAVVALVRYAAVGNELRARCTREAQSIMPAPRVLICGPLFNYTLDSGNGKRFHSLFWGGLPRALIENGYHVAWLHYFYPHDQVPNVRAGREILAQINDAAPGNGMHTFVEGYSSAVTIARVTWRWLRITIESLLVGAILASRFKRAIAAIYWPVISDDWARAFRGWSCVENLFYGECFQRALAQLPRQDECIFLMENQGWERALLRAWRKYHHGRITGVPHSTIRYWDLRYHCDARRYAEAYRQCLPSADVVALNGAAARREYLATCAIREPVVDCEALRYLHLQPAARQMLPRGDRRTSAILILGDYTMPRTEAMLRLMEEAAHKKSNTSMEVWLKLHPSCSPTYRPQLSLHCNVVTAPVAQLALRADLVFASNTTSAAVDAYVSGGYVVVHDDGCGPNFSPLRGVPGVRFVGTSDELLATLAEIPLDRSQARLEAQGFFTIDSGLPRWRRYFERACPE